MMTLSPFQAIFDRAAKRKGGAAALEAMLFTPKTADELAAIPDHRWLSMMSRVIFATGLNWQVVENKWDGIEEAYEGFDTARMAMMSDDNLDRLLGDVRIIRQGAKILSVRDNAVFLRVLAQDHGTVGRFFGEWPSEDFVGLLDLIKQRGSRLGGATGGYALRQMGVDSIVFTKDVGAALVREGVVDKAPTSKKGMRAAQDAFNIWRAESGRPLSQIGQVLAMSLGET